MPDKDSPPKRPGQYARRSRQSKAKQAESTRRYLQTEKGREARRRYWQSDKGKASRRAAEQRRKGERMLATDISPFGVADRVRVRETGDVGHIWEVVKERTHWAFWVQFLDESGRSVCLYFDDGELERIT